MIQEVGVLFSCRARDTEKSLLKLNKTDQLFGYGSFRLKMAAAPECTQISSLGKGDSLHQQGGNKALRYLMTLANAACCALKPNVYHTLKNENQNAKFLKKLYWPLVTFSD